MKIEILICTGLILNDHSNPYIESTTVLSDRQLYKNDKILSAFHRLVLGHDVILMVATTSNCILNTHISL